MEIYLITDKTNGKQYVGLTTNTKEHRWKEHLHGNLYVDNAIRKHKPENFTLETLELCVDREQLRQREQYWIKEKNTLIPDGYNVLPGEGCYASKKSKYYDVEKYFRRIYFPKCNLQKAKHIAMYIFNSQDIHDYLLKYDKNNLLEQIWLEDEIQKFVKNVLSTNDFLKELTSQEILYAPSLNTIKDFIPDDYVDDYCGYYPVSLNWYRTAIYDHRLIYNAHNYNLCMYLTEANEDDYIEWAEKQVAEKIKYYQIHPEEWEDILREQKENDERRRGAIERDAVRYKQRVLDYSKQRIKEVVKYFKISQYKSGLYGCVIKFKDGVSYKTDELPEKIQALNQCYNWLVENKYMEFETIDDYIKRKTKEENRILKQSKPTVKKKPKPKTITTKKQSHKSTKTNLESSTQSNNKTNRRRKSMRKRTK